MPLSHISTWLPLRSSTQSTKEPAECRLSLATIPQALSNLPASVHFTKAGNLLAMTKFLPHGFVVHSRSIAVVSSMSIFKSSTPGIVLVNKQLYREAKKVFYSRNAFAFSRPWLNNSDC